MKKLFTSAFAFALCMGAFAQDEIVKTDIDMLWDDVVALQEAMRMKADVSDLNEKYEELSSVIQQLSKFQESFNDEVMVPLQEAIEAVDVTNEVQGLQEAMRGKANVEAVEEYQEWNETQIKALFQWQQNFDEEYMSAIEARINEVDVTNEVQGLQEAMRGKANVEDIAELQEAMEIVSSDLQGLMESMRNVARVDVVEEEIDYLTQTVKQLSMFQESFNDEVMVPLQEAMEALDVTNEVQGLQESMRGKANVDDVVALQEAMDIVSSDLQGLMEATRGNAKVEDVMMLADGLDLTQTDVMNLSLANKVNHTAVNGLILAVEALKNAVLMLGGDVTGVDVPEIIEVGEEEDPAVGVEGVEAAKAVKGIYNLAGQKTDAAQKGIYIVDGKKVQK